MQQLQMYPLHVVPFTENEKLGSGVATTYRPVGDASKGEGTCSGNCQLLHSKKCYTYKGKTHMWQRRSWDRHDSLDKITANKGKRPKLVRLHTSGDFFTTRKGRCVTDMAYVSDVLRFARENPDILIFTYCHDIVQLLSDLDPTGMLRHDDIFPSNMVVIASCDTQEQVLFAKARGFRTARVIDHESDRNPRTEVFCPYDRALHHGKTSRQIAVRCTSCRLCFDDKARDIAFLKH